MACGMEDGKTEFRTVLTTPCYRCPKTPTLDVVHEPRSLCGHRRWRIVRWVEDSLHGSKRVGVRPYYCHQMVRRIDVVHAPGGPSHSVRQRTIQPSLEAGGLIRSVSVLGR